VAIEVAKNAMDKAKVEVISMEKTEAVGEKAEAIAKDAKMSMAMSMPLLWFKLGGLKMAHGILTF